jgi:hypothetical protein
LLNGRRKWKISNSRWQAKHCNTYVWDADGGLRTESQSFANTAEHSIGGAFSLNDSLGG